ncbi:MAG: SpoIIE family protein phosphatase, partial [Candidatus Gracilibacteria bacterium]|nr:SpoIIE family protein phosphatase [Candidatus Gracilibacteria bacterium]
FVYFNREIRSILSQNENISSVKILNYEGKIIYDSNVDTDRRYEGDDRIVNERLFLNQVKSKNISFKIDGGKTVYLKMDDNDKVSFVDKDEKLLDELVSGFFVEYFVLPVNDRYAVIYDVDYSHLYKRVELITERIVYLAIFGIMLGMLLSFVLSSKITKPIGKLVESANEIAKGNFQTQVDIKTGDEISFLGETFNQMAKDLESSVEAKLYKERVTSELKIASTIQQQLLPKDIPNIKGLEVSAGIIPAEEIGGDVYDFLKTSDEKVLFYLGDVTGHGVPAGIVSSIASALFYGYSKESDLEKIITEVNRVLKAKTLTNMFMTLCLMQWESSAKKFSYVNAGHEQIIHYKAKEKEVELVPAGGIALGMLPDVSNLIKTQEVDLQVGDYLVIYSDGIPEAWRNKDEMYGMERFQNAVKYFGNDLVTSLAMKKAILSDVKQFCGDYKQMDDITLIVVKRVE